jgi:hypothetical protein
MKAKSKDGKAIKPSLKVRDLKTFHDPRGGRKAGKGQQEFINKGPGWK